MSATKSKKLHEDNRIDNWSYLWMGMFSVIGYLLFSVVHYLFGTDVLKGFGAAIVAVLVIVMIYSAWKKTNSERRTVYLILFMSIVLRLCYLIVTAQEEYTGAGYEIFNDVRTNLTLPDAFQPLYYVAAAFVYNFMGMFRFTQPYATECVRLVTEYLGVVSAIAVYYILCELEVNDTGVYLCTALVAFHPGLIMLGGEISPVMTTFTLLVFTTLFLSRWNNYTDGYNFLMMSIAFGLAVMTDLSALAYSPVILALMLINVFRAIKRRSAVNILSTALQTAGGLVIWAILSFAYPLKNAAAGKENGIMDLFNAVSQNSGKMDLKQTFLAFSADELLGGFVRPDKDKIAWIYWLKSSVFGSRTGSETLNLTIVSGFMMLAFAVAVIAAAMVICNIFTHIDAKKKVNIWTLAALLVAEGAYFVLVNTGRPGAESMEFKVAPALLLPGVLLLGTGMKIFSMKKKLNFAAQVIYLAVTVVCLAFCVASVVYGCLFI